MKVVICLIATRKYKIFIQPLVDSIKKYFLLNHQIEIILFIDDITFSVHGDERVTIIKDLIPAYTFPAATLYRYAIMTSRTYECDYIFYLDIDYLLVDTIDEEILGDIVAVLHPGFSVLGGGSWCDDKKSNAYTFPENRKQYFAGGTQGGEHEHYYRAMQRMKREIEDDEKRNVKAEWNDESHWNRALSEMKYFKILDSRYCCVESMHLRKSWGLGGIKPKILALDKNHSEIRE